MQVRGRVVERLVGCCIQETDGIRSPHFTVWSAMWQAVPSLWWWMVNQQICINNAIPDINLKNRNIRSTVIFPEIVNPIFIIFCEITLHNV